MDTTDETYAQEQSAEEVQQDGMDFYQQDQAIADDFDLQDQEVQMKLNDRDQFVPYMQQIFGEEEFERGYQVIGENRNAAFHPEGRETINQTLSQIFGNEGRANLFYNACMP